MRLCGRVSFGGVFQDNGTATATTDSPAASIMKASGEFASAPPFQDNRTATVTTDSPAASITLVKVVPKVGSTYVWKGMSSLSSQL